MAASTMCIAAFFAILAVGHSAQAEPTTGARKLLQMSPMMMGMSGSPMMMSSMSPSPMMMMSPSPSMMMSSTSKPMMYMLKLTPSMEVPAVSHILTLRPLQFSAGFFGSIPNRIFSWPRNM